jgi:ankyrin repeat protein
MSEDIIMKKIRIIGFLVFFHIVSNENFFNSLQNAIKSEDIIRCETIFSGMEKPVNFMQQQGAPLVHSAVCANLPVFLALFLGYKAPADYTDSQGYTPLMRASCHEYVQCIQLLIAHGAQVNYQNRHGLTALHCAVDWEKIDAIEELLKHGADLFKPTCAGDTPYQIAQASFNRTHLIPIVSKYYKRMLDTNSKKLAIEQNKDCLKATFVSDHLKKSNYDYCGVAIYRAALSGHRVNGINALNYIKKLPPEAAQYEAVKYLYNYCFPEPSEMNKN